MGGDPNRRRRVWIPAEEESVRRKPTLAAVSVIALSGILVAAWLALDWPPPGFVLRHGPPPAGRPTGRTRTDSLGQGIVELAPGYARLGSHRQCDEGDLLGRICAPLGLEWGEHPDHRFEEGPVAWVEIERPFWISTTEVTNDRYEAFEPGFERHLAPGDAPVVNRSFESAVRFCEWLSGREPGTYRLPFDSEWEYACRAGTATAWSFGDDPDLLGEHAWYVENSDWRTRPVASRKPNPWGLFDLHGNALEWVDTLDPYRLDRIDWDGRPWSQEDREHHQEEIRRRVMSEVRGAGYPEEEVQMLASMSLASPDRAGGSWAQKPEDCRSASRDGETPGGGVSGFRVVWVPEDY